MTDDTAYRRLTDDADIIPPANNELSPYVLSQDVIQDEYPASQKPFDDDSAPKDIKNTVFVCLFVLGLATFFPSTAIIASNDYYEVVWQEKGKKLVFIAPILIQIVAPIIQVFLTKYQERLTYTIRIQSALVLNSLIAFIFAFQASLLPNWLSFLVACLAIILVGANNSVLKCTELSLVSMYPSVYTQVLLVGQAASPVSVLLIKVLLKKFYTPGIDSTQAEKDSAAKFIALVFFIISGLFTTLAAFLYRVARKSAFSKHYFPNFKTRYNKYLDAKRQYQTYKDQQILNNSTDSTIQNDIEYQPPTDLGYVQTSINSISAPPSQDDLRTQTNSFFINPKQDDPGNPEEMSKVDHVEHGLSIMPQKIRKLEVFAKVRYYAIVLGLSCIPPCAVYPSLLNVMEPKLPFEVSPVWYHLLMLLVYCLTDILSRAIPLHVINRICPLDKIEWIIGFRFIIYFILLIVTYMHYKISSFVHIALVMITASMQAMALVAILTNYKQKSNLTLGEGNVAGSISAIAIACGVLIGYLIALGLDSIITAIW